MSSTTRNLSIDRFRGALVILMVIGDYFSGIQWVPDALKHAPDVGLTIADTVAPAFVFVIGLNYGPSFQRRMSDGAIVAYRYFFMRYLSYVGIGAVIAGAANMVGQPTDWGVLQSIGVAGLIGLAFVRASTWVRLVGGIALLAAYQYLLDVSMLNAVLNSVHGGLYGSVAWGALLVLATVLADFWRKGVVPYLVACGGLTVLALISVVLIPVSKHRVSLSFVMVTLAIAAISYLVIEWQAKNRFEVAGPISWWGQHALALYLIHLVVLGVFVIPSVSWWYSEVPLWLAALQLTSILGALSLVAWQLSRRKLKAN